MKIAFIGQKGIPAKLGGVEHHVEELATRLAADGHEVFVYVRNNYTDKKLQEFKGVKLVHLPSVPSKHLDAISHTLFSILHAIFHEYDVIHFHSIGPSSLSFLIKVLKPKTALIATYHCQDYLHQKWGRFAQMCLRFGEAVTCKVPNKTIAVSKLLKKYIKDRYAVDAAYIPNGFIANLDTKTDLIEKWGLEKNNYILVVSRLVKHKGIHYLIEAFKDLERKNLTQNKKLVIVGDGFYTDQYVDQLREMAENENNILFIGGQTGDVLSQLFSNAYIFVQPSETEGMSIALLEAMGYAKTVLVSDIPENMEVVENAGFSFQNKNVTDLGQKLGYLLANSEVVGQMAVRAKERVDQNYSWNDIAKNVELAYQGVIAEKK